MTFIEAKIANPQTGRNGTTVKFLVDTGAYLSVVPSPVLNKLGTHPFTRRQFRLADGKHIARRVGTARFEIEKYVGEAVVIFGEKNDEPLLGVITLESLGLTVDPRSRKLKPTEMYLMKISDPINRQLV